MEKQGVSGTRIAMVYIGTVVGAGFATGQEILQFFAAFGIGGLWGIALSTVLFVVYGVLIMRIGMAASAVSHREMLAAVGGPMFRVGMDALIMLSLFGALTAMLAGTGALFGQQFGLAPALGAAMMGVLTVLTVLRGLRGVIGAISAVVPFLLVAVVVVCVFVLMEGGNIVPESGRPRTIVPTGLVGNWIWAAVLYGAYNILMSAAVLAPLGAEASDRRAIFRGGALGGIGLGAASVMIYLAISASHADVGGLEVPMLYLAGRISPMAGVLFALVLLAEVYTTAVGALYGFSARVGARNSPPSEGWQAKPDGVASRGCPPRRTTPPPAAAPLHGRGISVATLGIVGTAIAAFFASLLGFSNLVRYLYPLQGYGGVVFLVVLGLAWRRGRGRMG
ncbi:MAG: hypothetical protein FWE08_00745 [Oscillospiraceae bacterium]|nr:hypothetical protein [Oscillospiraceae bacterium]